MFFHVTHSNKEGSLMAAPIVTIRLNPQSLAALTAAAKAAGRTRSAHAAHLVQAGLDGSGGPAREVGEHSLSASVEAMFAAVEGIDVDAQLESARVLVQVADAGGSPAVAAIRELRLIYSELERLTDRKSRRGGLG
jgi:hypothetical protein